MKTLKDILGKNVKLQREKLDLTQVDLADKAGLARQVIVNIEGGAVWPVFTTIEAIAGAMGVAATSLFVQVQTENKSEDFKEAINHLTQAIEHQQTTIMTIRAMLPKHELTDLVAVASRMTGRQLELLVRLAKSVLEGKDLSAYLGQSQKKVR